MRYAIYYTWKDDNSRDTFNADNAKERDMNIRNLISRNKFKDISYCPIYANGEYGIRKKVL